MNTKEAAQYLNLSVTNLNNRRYRELPPIYLKAAGGSVRYRRKDLDYFKEAQAKQTVFLPRNTGRK